MRLEAQEPLPPEVIRRARSPLALALLLAACAGQPRAGAPGDGAARAPALPVDAIRWVGRVDLRDPAGARLGWQGAGLVATVRGTRIAVRLRAEGALGTIYFQPVVDGTPGPRFAVPAGEEDTVVLGAGLGAGAHRVELYRDTEGLHPAATFLGFTEGAVQGPPPAGGRLLEVVGDSISAGYGDLGAETHPGGCIGTSDNSSWYRTYAAVAGRALGAEVSTVALSGWGLSEDNTNGRERLLGKVYGHAAGALDPAPWTFPRAPQAVVVNLGTNDQAYGLDEAGFVREGLALVGQIRARAPDAWIFFVIGSMLDGPELALVKHAQQVLVHTARSRGDARVEHFDLGTPPPGAHGEVPTGCQRHPSAVEHERMAQILEAHLRARLGW
jgi:lysophospholipase L1-like esterase